MQQIEKLDRIIIEDDLNLSSQEIFERAQGIVEDRSKTFGWHSVELRAAPNVLSVNVGFKRYEFDVFGIAGERIELSNAADINSKEQISKSAASPEAEI
jgi:hypothetical protein